MGLKYLPTFNHKKYPPNVGTLSPIIMVQWKITQNERERSYWPIFHFPDYGRKDNYTIPMKHIKDMTSDQTKVFTLPPSSILTYQGSDLRDAGPKMCSRRHSQGLFLDVGRLSQAIGNTYIYILNIYIYILYIYVYIYIYGRFQK